MVKFDLKEVATVSSKPGLYKVLKPTRSGIIIEALDDSKKRMMVQTRHKISLLHEISIFTNDEKGSLPLEEVFANIYTNYGEELSIESDSSEAELRDFIEEIVENHDEERVYTSDIKKLISWYNIVSKHNPPTIEEEKPKAKAKPKAKKTEKSEEKPKKKATKKTTEK